MKLVKLIYISEAATLKVDLKSFTKFTEKQLSLAYNVPKNKGSNVVLSCEFCKVFGAAFYRTHDDSASNVSF